MADTTYCSARTNPGRRCVAGRQSSLMQVLSTVPDPRCARGMRHRLEVILVVAEADREPTRTASGSRDGATAAGPMQRNGTASLRRPDAVAPPPAQPSICRRSHHTDPHRPPHHANQEDTPHALDHQRPGLRRSNQPDWSAWCFSDWGSFSFRESIGWRPCQQRDTQTSLRPRWCVR